MNHRPITATLLAGALAGALAACGAPQAAQPTVAPTRAAAAAPAPTAAPAQAAAPTAIPLSLGISGAGQVLAAQDADLSFQVQGTVDQVLVEEGAQVKKGDLLAILDTRGFDQQLAQAEAGLASAQAAASALTESPREADLAAAQAGVRSAQANLAATRGGAKPIDIQTAEAGVALAQANLQSTRDRLSFAKTQAELAVEQAALQLTQAQARYAQSKYNWTYVQETGNDPIVPTIVVANRPVDNKLSDGQRENYYAQFVQAEAALKLAEKGVELSTKAADSARQAEVSGIAAAEAQLRQSELGLTRLRNPVDAERIAAAEAALAQARAQESRVLPDPRDSQVVAARAQVAGAEAALTLARINRERAELRAPFDGVIAIVNIDPGDPSVVQGRPAIQVVDLSSLRVEVSISDVDIARVREGQQAEVRIDGIPGRSYPGTVSFVSPVAANQGAVRSYVVRVALDDTTDLRAGMSARVDIQE